MSKSKQSEDQKYVNQILQKIMSVGKIPLENVVSGVAMAEENYQQKQKANVEQNQAALFKRELQQGVDILSQLCMDFNVVPSVVKEKENQLNKIVEDIAHRKARMRDERQKAEISIQKLTQMNQQNEQLSLNIAQQIQNLQQNLLQARQEKDNNQVKLIEKFQEQEINATNARFIVDELGLKHSKRIENMQNELLHTQLEIDGLSNNLEKIQSVLEQSQSGFSKSQTQNQSQMLQLQQKIEQQAKQFESQAAEIQSDNEQYAQKIKQLKTENAQFTMQIKKPIMQLKNMNVGQMSGLPQAYRELFEEQAQEPTIEMAVHIGRVSALEQKITELGAQLCNVESEIEEKEQMFVQLLPEKKELEFKVQQLEAELGQKQYSQQIDQMDEEIQKQKDIIKQMQKQQLRPSSSLPQYYSQPRPKSPLRDYQSIVFKPSVQEFDSKK